MQSASKVHLTFDQECYFEKLNLKLKYLDVEILKDLKKKENDDKSINK